MALAKRKNRLREVRNTLGVSGYDLQLLSNINVQRIYLIERGLVNPNKSERARLAAALEFSENEVFPTTMRFNKQIEKT